MDLGIAGRRAAVAAASQGLGFGVAQALANEGVKVAICARRREAVDRGTSEGLGLAINVAGALRFATDRDTRLDVGLIKVQATDQYGEEGFDCTKTSLVPTAEDQIALFVRQSTRNGKSNPLGCSGDEHDFSLQGILGKGRRLRHQTPFGR